MTPARWRCDRSPSRPSPKTPRSSPAAWQRETRSSPWACRSSSPAPAYARLRHANHRQNNRRAAVKGFNLSQWAITHRALVLFMIIVLGAGGIYSYFNLGRAEDPSFTIKVMIVNVAWPGATAAEMQTQVADKIEKKLQELPYLDRIESYSQPGVSFIEVYLVDKTLPAAVKELWYQVRKKVGDIKNDVPAGVIGPNFNDEYGDVYSAIYMLTADGLTLADLKARAE